MSTISLERRLEILKKSLEELESRKIWIRFSALGGRILNMHTCYICLTFEDACESASEEDEIIRWFNSEKPSLNKHINFFMSDYFMNDSDYKGSTSWFTGCKGGIELRFDFLKHLIQLTEQKVKAGSTMYSIDLTTTEIYIVLARLRTVRAELEAIPKHGYICVILRRLHWKGEFENDNYFTLNWFQSQMPTETFNSEYYYKYGFNPTDVHGWWEPNKEGRFRRREFLDYLINCLQSELYDA